MLLSEPPARSQDQHERGWCQSQNVQGHRRGVICWLEGSLFPLCPAHYHSPSPVMIVIGQIFLFKAFMIATLVPSAAESLQMTLGLCAKSHTVISQPAGDFWKHPKELKVGIGKLQSDLPCARSWSWGPQSWQVHLTQSPTLQRIIICKKTWTCEGQRRHHTKQMHNRDLLFHFVWALHGLRFHWLATDWAFLQMMKR